MTSSRGAAIARAVSVHVLLVSDTATAGIHNPLRAFDGAKDGLLSMHRSTAVNPWPAAVQVLPTSLRLTRPPRSGARHRQYFAAPTHLQLDRHPCTLAWGRKRGSPANEVRVSQQTRRACVRVWQMVAMILLAACGGGDAPTPPVTPSASPGFVLSVSGTTPAAIVQAGSGSASVSIARTGSFNSAVALTVEGVPAGVTITPSTGAVAVGSTSTSIAIDVSLNVPAGAYPLTIRGQAPGITSQSATLTLVVVTRPASIALSRANANALSVNAAGSSVTFTVVLNRIEFPGEVTLDVAAALPTGVTLTFAPNPTSGGSVVATLTATANAVAGNYTAQLRGTGTGITPSTLSVVYTVVGQASLAVSISRTTVSMPQNGSGLTSISLVRTNFAAAVTLTATGLPAGVTGTFESNPTASNGTTLNFVVGPSVVPGSYPVTITGTAPGVPTSSAGMTVIITATGVGGNTAVRFCGAAENIPIWLGHSATGTSWTRVVIGANTTFSFDFPTQGFLAWVTQKGVDDFRVNITAATRDELAVLTAAQCASPSSRTATGTVSGIGAADLVQLVLGPRASATTPTFASPTFTFADLPDGAMDLLATRATADADGISVNRVLVQRSANPPNGGSLGTLNLANALPTESKTLTVQGAVGAEQVLTGSSLRTAGGVSISLGSATATGGSAGSYRHVNVAQLLPGDFHILQAVATLTSGGYANSRSVTQLSAAPASATLSLGAVPAEPSVFLFDGSPDRARYSSFIPLSPDYRRLYFAGWFQQSGNTRRDVVMTVTDAVAAVSTGNMGTGVQVRAPDFSSAPGYLALWDSRRNLLTTYVVSASGWAATGGFSAPLADGVVTKSWTRSGPVPP